MKSNKLESILNVPNTGIVIIDMQNHYLEPFQHSPVLYEMIENQKNFLNLAMNFDIALYVIKMIWIEDKLIEELDEVSMNFKYQKDFFKEKQSAFSNIDFSYEIYNNKIKNLILMGVNASQCVLETAKDALKLGLNVTSSPSLIQDSKGIIPSWYEKNINWVN